MKHSPETEHSILRIVTYHKGLEGCDGFQNIFVICMRLLVKKKSEKALAAALGSTHHPSTAPRAAELAGCWGCGVPAARAAGGGQNPPGIFLTTLFNVTWFKATMQFIDTHLMSAKWQKQIGFYFEQTQLATKKPIKTGGGARWISGFTFGEEASTGMQGCSSHFPIKGAVSRSITSGFKGGHICRESSWSRAGKAGCCPLSLTAAAFWYSPGTSSWASQALHHKLFTLQTSCQANPKVFRL